MILALMRGSFSMTNINKPVPAAPFELFCSRNTIGKPRIDVGYPAARALNAANTCLAINAANGHTIVHDKTFVIADDGLQLSAGMVWNSSERKWRLDAGAANYSIDNALDDLQITENDGRVIHYKKDGDHYICCEPDARGLSRISFENDCLTRFFPDTGEREVFDEHNRLHFKNFPNGQSLEYSYSETGTLESIKLPSGRQLQTNGGLNLINPDGTTIAICAYRQDENGNLTTAIMQPDGSEYKTSYFSDQNTNSLTIISDDETKNIINLDATGAIKQVQEGQRKWDAILDDVNRTFTMSSQSGAQVVAEFDESKNWKSLTYLGKTKPISFKCDASGRVDEKTFEDNHVEKHSYCETTGLLESVTNLATGKSLTNEYNKDDTSLCFGAHLKQTISDNGIKATTENQYNARRQKQFVISPEKRIKEYVYQDEKPYRLHKVLIGKQAKLFGYDAYGRVNKVSKNTQKDVVLESIKTEKNIAGLITHTETAEKRIVDQVYDGLNRVTATIENGRAQSTSYVGNKTILKTANGLITETACDNAGLINSACKKTQDVTRESIISRNEDGTINNILYADGRVKKYNYRPAGRLSKSEMTGAATVEFNYDDNGKLISKKYYHPSEPNKSLTKYKLYDKNNNLQFEVTVKLVRDLYGAEKERAFVKEYQYQLGKCSAVIQYALPLNPNQISQLGTDNVLIANEHDRVTRYQHDLDGNLTMEWVMVESRPEKLGYAKKYQYDESNQCIFEFTYLEKKTFDADFKDIKSLVTRHWYDEAGRKIATLDADQYLVGYVYDLDGRLKQEIKYKEKQSQIDLNNDVITLPEATANDYVIKHEYDLFNREYLTTDTQKKLETRREFDLADNQTCETKTDLLTGEKRTTRAQFNAFSELTDSASARVCAAMKDENDKSKWVKKTIHPVTGLCLYTSDEKGKQTHYFYGKNKKPVLKIMPSGAVVKLTYDLLADDVTEIYAYATRLNSGILNTLNNDIKRDGYYDENIHQYLKPSETDKDQSLKKTFDAEGLLIEVVKQNQGREVNFYNAFSEKSATKREIEKDQFSIDEWNHDLRGNINESILDLTGERIVSSRQFNDPLNRPTAKVDAINYAVDITYEGLRKQTVTDVENHARHKETTQDAFMRSSSESDWKGEHATLHAYDDATRKHTIVNPVSSGRNISDTKNAFGETAELMVAGQTTKYGHDVDGQLSNTAHPDGSTESTGFDIQGYKENSVSLLGMESSYKTNDDGHIKNRTDDITDRKLTTDYDTDVFGNLKSETDATKLVVTSDIAQAGVVSTEKIDEAGLCLTKQRINNLVGHLIELSQGDAENEKRYREILERDALGNEKSRKIDLGNGKFAILHETKFDKAGHALEITNGNGDKTYHVYDKRGNKRFTVDRMGFVTENIFDENNYLVGSIQYAKRLETVDIEHIQEVVVASPEDFICQYINDADGLPIYEIRGQAVFEHHYDGAKRLTDTIAYAKPVNLNEVKLADIPALLNTDDYSKNLLNRMTHKEYDVMGRMSLERDGEGGEKVYRYDAAGNQVACIINGEREYYRVYDKFGNLRFKVDAEGYVKERRYNDAHVCTDKFAYYYRIGDVLSNEASAKLFATLGQYGTNRDLASILAAMTQVVGQVADDKYDVHLVKYLDKAHRLNGLQDGEGCNESYKIDGLGQKYEITDKLKGVWTNQFNAAKKIKLEKTPSFAITTVSQDADSKHLQQTTNAGSVESSFDYDDALNQTRTTLASNIDNDKRSLVSGYDKSSQINGTTIENAKFEKDGIEHNEAITTKIIRDYAGREVLSVNANGAKDFTVYDSSGRKRFTVDATGYVVEFTYDNAFSEPNTVIHYATAMSESFLAAKNVGLTLAEMNDYVIANQSQEDRKLYYTYNRNGKKLTVKKSPSLTASASFTEDDKREITVKLFERNVTYQYNKFGEIIAESHARVDGKPDSTIQHFYDKNGNEIATVTAQGVVTLRTFGMENCRKEGNRYIELTSTTYFNPVPANCRHSLQAILKTLVLHQSDRKTTSKYDRRHLRIEKTESDGHIFYSTYRDEDGHLQVKAESSEVTTKTEYDDNGKPIVITDPYEESCYFIRNAVGDVVWEIGFPVEVAEGVKQRPVRQYLYNAHQQRVGTHIYALPAKLEFDDNGHIKLENLVDESALDEKELILMCNRGLALITQNNAKGTTYASYNEVRAPLRTQRVVTVSDENANGVLGEVSVTREEVKSYNLRSDIVMEAVTDEFGTNQTHYKVNAFRERTDEGPVPDEYYIKNCFDNAGNKWFTNADKGIATITVTDELDHEVVTFRSQNTDLHEYLKENGYDLVKSQLADADYEKAFGDFQKWVTYRNEDGQTIRQDTPYYSKRPKFEPENCDVTFTVIKDPNPPSTNYMLRFDVPDEVFLTMEFKLRLKGNEEWSPMTITPYTDHATGRDYCVIPLGDMASDAYEYSLDFYHKSESGVVSRYPSYRADGEVMLDAGHYEKSTQPIWYMENSDTMLIVGKAANISGIELISNGQIVKRLAGTRGVDGKLRIDLSNVKLDQYDFRYISGTKVLADGLVLGQVGNNSVNVYRPGFIFNSEADIATLPSTLPGDFANHLRFRTALATKAIPDGSIRNPNTEYYELQWLKIYMGKPLSSAYVSIEDIDGNQHFLNQIIANGP